MKNDEECPLGEPDSCCFNNFFKSILAIIRFFSMNSKVRMGIMKTYEPMTQVPLFQSIRSIMVLYYQHN